MSQDLLQYEFWETADKYYAKLFDRVPTEDLLKIRQCIAENTLARFDPAQKITWLDIGTGDAATLLEIFKQDQDFDKRQITLVTNEPSSKAISLLKNSINKFSNIRLEVITDNFDLSLVAGKKIDIITSLHSSYYLGKSETDFENLFSKLFESLNDSGVLLVQGIASNSDFRNLETKPYPYSLYSCGDYTKKIFKKFWGGADGKEFLTRFDVTSYLQENLSGDMQADLKQFYLFIRQNPHLEFSQEVQNAFFEKIKKFAVKSDSKYYLDFKDWIVWVKK